MNTAAQEIHPAAETDATETAAMTPAIAPPSQSVVARFLQVRGLDRKPSTGAQVVAKSQRLPPSQRPLWSMYTKRKCGDRIDFQRAAMRVRDDSYSDSVDVYNPKKKPMELIKIHEHADDVSGQFLYFTRSLFFEREIVDQPVCDLIENRGQHDQRLDLVYFDGNDELGDHGNTDNSPEP